MAIPCAESENARVSKTLRMPKARDLPLSSECLQRKLAEQSVPLRFRV